MTGFQTHCLRGHEMTGENLYWRRDGRRECRACTRLRENERRHGRPKVKSPAPQRVRSRTQERYPKEPFVRWIDALAGAYELQTLCRATKTSDRILRRVRLENQEGVTLEVIDRFVVAVGEPQVLNELYPLCDVCLAGIGEDDDNARCALGIEEMNGLWRCEEHLTMVAI